MLISKRFSPEVTAMLSLSREEALRLNNDKVTPACMMLGLIRQAGGRTLNLLTQLRVDITLLKKRMEQIARGQSSEIHLSTDEMALDDAANRIIKLSVLESVVTKSDTIEIEHILLGTLRVRHIGAVQNHGAVHQHKGQASRGTQFFQNFSRIGNARDFYRDPVIPNLIYLGFRTVGFYSLLQLVDGIVHIFLGRCFIGCHLIDRKSVV